MQLLMPYTFVYTVYKLQQFGTVSSFGYLAAKVYIDVSCLYFQEKLLKIQTKHIKFYITESNVFRAGKLLVIDHEIIFNAIFNEADAEADEKNLFRSVFGKRMSRLANDCTYDAKSLLNGRCCAMNLSNRTWQCMAGCGVGRRSTPIEALQRALRWCC